MEQFDFGIGWPEVRPKKDLFIDTLESEIKQRKLSFICIDEKKVNKLTEDIKKGKLKIKFFLDMASETYDLKHPFTKLVYTIKDSGTRIVDDPDDVKAAADKSITHFDLIASKVPVPFSVVIRHWEPSRKLTEYERAGLNHPFVIKPAKGYGQKGIKIITKKMTLKDIGKARKFSPGDNFLLQEFIKPLEIEKRPAWFRVYHLFGEIIPCWWNPETHEYKQVTLKEMSDYRLLPLIRITSEIGRITRIDWFSCEIAINSKNRKFVVIDYMNDQCAIYPKSEHKDGVPDDLIVLIAQRLAEKASRYVRGEYTLTYRSIWFPKIKVVDENA
ncbi:MAG: hypothetical protein ABIE74_11230 [Pseudomonadota bacterium]